MTTSEDSLDDLVDGGSGCGCGGGGGNGGAGTNAVGLDS